MVQPLSASFTFVFARKGISPKTGKGLLQVRVYFNKHQMPYISTGCHFEQTEWDQLHAAIVDNKKERELPAYLLKKLREVKKFRQEIEEFETGLIHQGKALNPELLKSFVKKEKPLSFNEFMEAQLKADQALKASTKRPHQNTLNKLNEYKPRIEFDQVDYSLIENFHYFLLKQKLNLNSINGHHTRVGKYINNAISKAKLEINPYIQFRKNNKKKLSQEVVKSFLLMEEIEQIEKLDYSDNPKLDRIKDLFLFSCYCGLRFSDLMELKREHLSFTDKGIEIKKKQVKVSSSVHLPLHTLFNGKGEIIVKKYLKDDQEALFQAISNQKANENLKYIQYDAKISKNLTMHTARHTFATQLAVRVPNVHFIAKLLGHTDIKSSMAYVKMSEEIIDEILNKTEW